MKELEGVYVVGLNEPKIYFSYELFTQGSEKWDLALFSHLVSALETFASEINQKEMKLIELSANKVFATIDEKYDIVVIIKCRKNVKDAVAFELLQRIKQKFLENFKTYAITPEDMKFVKTSIFSKDLRKILKENSDINKFLKSL